MSKQGTNRCSYCGGELYAIKSLPCPNCGRIRGQKFEKKKRSQASLERLH